MRLIAAILALLIAAPAVAQDRNLAHGNGFYAACSSPAEDWMRAACLAYVKGMHDMAAHWIALGRIPMLCATPAVTVEQFFDIFVKYLRDNPSQRQRYSSDLFWSAAAQSYPPPCR